MSGTDDELLIEAHGDVRIVVLNRPAALNAADEALHGRLASVWRTLAEDPGIRAIVLTGAGKAFSGGGDLDLLRRMTEDRALRARIMDEAAEIVQTMTTVPVPIVAAVNGPAVGLGCSLAAMSDLVLMEEQAYFADPHVALGLVAADGGGADLAAADQPPGGQGAPLARRSTPGRRCRGCRSRQPCRARGDVHAMPPSRWPSAWLHFRPKRSGRRRPC